MGSLAAASLDERERRAVERLVEMLRRELGADLRSIWLYGSRARDEARRPDSDVDLLVVTRAGAERDFDRVLDLAMDAAEAEELSIFRVSPVVTAPEWVEGRRAIDSFFIQEVDRDKIVLAGDP